MKQSRASLQTRLLYLMLPALLLVACSSQTLSPAASFVDLDNLQALPTPREPSDRPLRVGIAAVISPQGSAESYSLLLDYLSDQLGRPVERVQRRTYAEVNELLSTGEIDLAFVCTSSYLLGKRESGLGLLVAPQVNGEVTYRAILIVPANSSANSIGDLQGKVFAFTDPDSFTGRIYPTYLLQGIEANPDTFFADTFFTYSHDDAIRAVAEGIADGATVDSLVLDFALKRQPELADRIRVIHVSPAFGMPPVVVSSFIRPQMLAELETILLTMHETVEGRAALQALDYDRFVPVSDEDYRSAEDIELQVLANEANP